MIGVRNKYLCMFGLACIFILPSDASACFFGGGIPPYRYLNHADSMFVADLESIKVHMDTEGNRYAALSLKNMEYVYGEEIGTGEVVYIGESEYKEYHEYKVPGKYIVVTINGKYASKETRRRFSGAYLYSVAQAGTHWVIGAESIGSCNSPFLVEYSEKNLERYTSKLDEYIEKSRLEAEKK